MSPRIFRPPSDRLRRKWTAATLAQDEAPHFLPMMVRARARRICWRIRRSRTFAGNLLAACRQTGRKQDFYPDILNDNVEHGLLLSPYSDFASRSAARGRAPSWEESAGPLPRPAFSQQYPRIFEVGCG